MWGDHDDAGVLRRFSDFACVREDSANQITSGTNSTFVNFLNGTVPLLKAPCWYDKMRESWETAININPETSYPSLERKPFISFIIRNVSQPMNTPDWNP